MAGQPVRVSGSFNRVYSSMQKSRSIWLVQAGHAKYLESATFQLEMVVVREVQTPVACSGPDLTRCMRLVTFI